MALRQFEYLVLFTVSATESEDEGHIVLLAWEIISTAKNQVVGKEQCFVRPAHGVSGDDCLPPGISLEAVQGAKPLSAVLKQFTSSLKKLGGGSLCLLTHGPLPLRHHLIPEAQRSEVPLDTYFYRYLDINKEFFKAFPDCKKGETLEEMGEFIGVDLSGSSQKVGLEKLDAVSSVAQKLVSQGHTFEKPEIVQQSCNHSASPDPSLVQDGCIVRLRGLPFQASLKDILRFLTGLNCIPGGLVFGINSVGKRTGEAVVVLESSEHADLALRRHKHYLNQRYIEVYEATPDEFLKLAGSSSEGGGSDKVQVVRMQGLPYRASEEDIVTFFGSVSPVKEGANGVLIVRYPDGRASGDAFAIFDSEQHLEKALEKDRSSMGSRYVELFRSSLKEFETVLNRSTFSEQQQHFADLLDLHVTESEMDSVRGKERNCVKLRGLPYTSTAEDVLNFFGDLKEDIACQGVHMVLNPMLSNQALVREEPPVKSLQNRPTGDCYVQMKSVDAASRASKDLHKKYMSNRYIEVFQCSGDEVGHALMDSGGAGWSTGAGRRRRTSGGVSVKCRGLPYSTTEEELADFFAEFDVRESDVELIYNKSGRAAGIAYVTFSTRSLAQQAIREKNGKHIGHRYVELSMN